MRCKNCGWDNHNGSVKCEKCNAPLSRNMADEEVSNEYYEAGEFRPQFTSVGCSLCGYPLRPADTKCPNCGGVFPGNEKVTEKDVNQEPPRGTVIQGSVSDKDYGNKERRRLVGFLVTFSATTNGEFFPLFEGKNTIGRDRSSNICIQNDPNISEKHLSILFRPVEQKFKFKDEQSSNGTFINGELMDEGELKNLDKIRIGETSIILMEIPQTAFE